MPAPTADRRILFVHAHPDDEVINSGIVMAKYAAEGAHVTLVTCTLGEEGEILVPGLVHLAADQDDALGPQRINELAAAMGALGVTDNRFLGGPGRYRDSGMIGTPSNEQETCFWRADVDEASAHLVEVLREVRPQVLVTYDEIGGYGHPDHIQAHRVSMRAAELAADPGFRPDLGEAWSVAKIYWYALPFSFLQAGIDAMRAAGDTEFFNGVEKVEDLGMGVPDELITTQVEDEAYIDAKMAAMRAHETQITVDGPFFALSNNLGQKIWAVECFRLVGGTLFEGATPAGALESDLFAHL
ncbi:N-acetyl-1-D-myo-inositol-2-amino-2-deoxy-alpha-D-glucopyranoside deacetylase [Sporichthya sp.]|uniref:N-acetyl-1-D-myo-inositol-2-amino-2-deoxy-alpha- D-glucopyranoside deacetylase n=1 Tax=Sporichthya sp. TaxID=65475 RepID=UPI0017D7FCEB|nr:N-acetyl-1-D-myo-inositol-2-amino-2-deoxy-alpha-D-glucopyranoside deacetylase [Sporichthya sp.]MBA3742159.1 N-acetyl-1-D-myo-inositol-2-amino-2-deoxy-alpha-D-glucopyranoside deacetylase [Sporichthya sp.]